MKYITVPVVLIIFNRPSYTAQVWEAIRKARPSKLFIIADGPRNNEESEQCNEARKVVENIDWPCEVKKNYSNSNMGVRPRIESGINWVFEHTDRAIILEDDCIPDQSFFAFCETMLERYKNNRHIMMISGDNPLQNFPFQNSYTFSRYFAIWGWATWKRAWSTYDKEMKLWPEFKKNKKIFKTLSHRGVAAYLTALFDKAYHHKINSWATRWFYTCLFSNGFSIVPKNNLVSNIGVQGVHSSPGINNNVPNRTLDTDTVSHPTEVIWNSEYDKAFFRKTFPWRPLPHPREVILRLLVNLKHLFIKIKYKITGVITLKPKNTPQSKIRGRILLSYITQPFLRRDVSISHTNEWECLEIATIFRNRGFIVDVIDWNNKKFTPQKKYKILIDIHQNIDRLSTKVSDDCKKIFHITGAHWKFMNNAEKKRLESLEQRRGITLTPTRSVPPSSNIEHSDYGTILGNSFTQGTYSFANTPLYPIPISTPLTFEFPRSKDITKAKRRFIWFGGTGFVHKGLDLVLEAFLKMPEYELSVIGPIKKEPEFEKAFWKELYETPNIHTYGWLPINSDKFIEIVSNSIAVVYPSCSEGGGGSVITCMHIGLIPLVTYESSVNVEDFGEIIESATIDAIISTVQSLAKKSDSELLDRSKKSWEYAQKNHTREKFSKTYQEFVDTVLLN